MLSQIARLCHPRVGCFFYTCCLKVGGCQGSPCGCGWVGLRFMPGVTVWAGLRFMPCTVSGRGKQPDSYHCEGENFASLSIQELLKMHGIHCLKDLTHRIAQFTELHKADFPGNTPGLQPLCAVAGCSSTWHLGCLAQGGDPEMHQIANLPKARIYCTWQ